MAAQISNNRAPNSPRTTSALWVCMVMVGIALLVIRCLFGVSGEIIQLILGLVMVGISLGLLIACLRARRFGIAVVSMLCLLIAVGQLVLR